MCTGTVKKRSANIYISVRVTDNYTEKIPFDFNNAQGMVLVNSALRSVAGPEPVGAGTFGSEPEPILRCGSGST